MLRIHLYAALATCLAIVTSATSAVSGHADIIAKRSNEITHLPGYTGRFKSRHYGGYVNVDRDHNRHLYYYFVTSEGNPARDPLVLWLNGGPGCSSFDGFIYGTTRAPYAVFICHDCHLAFG